MDVRGPLPRSHQGDVHQSSSSTSSRRCVLVVEGATGRSDTEGEGTGCGSTGTRGEGTCGGSVDAGEGEDVVWRVAWEGKGVGWAGPR